MSLFLRRLAAMALLGLAAVLPARATPYSTDYSDLWWAGPAEDGWGVNVIQQGICSGCRATPAFFRGEPQK